MYDNHYYQNDYHRNHSRSYDRNSQNYHHQNDHSLQQFYANDKQNYYDDNRVKNSFRDLKDNRYYSVNSKSDSLHISGRHNYRKSPPRISKQSGRSRYRELSRSPSPEYRYSRNSRNQSPRSYRDYHYNDARNSESRYVRTSPDRYDKIQDREYKQRNISDRVIDRYGHDEREHHRRRENSRDRHSYSHYYREPFSYISRDTSRDENRTIHSRSPSSHHRYLDHGYRKNRDNYQHSSDSRNYSNDRSPVRHKYYETASQNYRENSRNRYRERHISPMPNRPINPPAYRNSYPYDRTEYSHDYSNSYYDHSDNKYSSNLKDSRLSLSEIPCRNAGSASQPLCGRETEPGYLYNTNQLYTTPQHASSSGLDSDFDLDSDSDLDPSLELFLITYNDFQNQYLAEKSAENSSSNIDGNGETQTTLTSQQEPQIPQQQAPTPPQFAPYMYFPSMGGTPTPVGPPQPGYPYPPYMGYPQYYQYMQMPNVSQSFCYPNDLSLPSDKHTPKSDEGSNPLDEYPSKETGSFITSDSCSSEKDIHVLSSDDCELEAKYHSGSDNCAATPQIAQANILISNEYCENELTPFETAIDFEITMPQSQQAIERFHNVPQLEPASVSCVQTVLACEKINDHDIEFEILENAVALTSFTPITQHTVPISIHENVHVVNSRLVPICDNIDINITSPKPNENSKHLPSHTIEHTVLETDNVDLTANDMLGKDIQLNSGPRLSPKTTYKLVSLIQKFDKIHAKFIDRRIKILRLLSRKHVKFKFVNIFSANRTSGK